MNPRLRLYSRVSFVAAKAPTWKVNTVILANITKAPLTLFACYSNLSATTSAWNFYSDNCDELSIEMSEMAYMLINFDFTARKSIYRIL